MSNVFFPGHSWESISTVVVYSPWVTEMDCWAGGEGQWGWLYKRILQKDGYSGILIVLENSVYFPSLELYLQSLVCVSPRAWGWDSKFFSWRETLQEISAILQIVDQFVLELVVSNKNLLVVVPLLVGIWSQAVNLVYSLPHPPPSPCQVVTAFPCMGRYMKW